LIVSREGIGQAVGTGAVDINATVELNADTTGQGGSISIDDIAGDLPIGLVTASNLGGDGAITLTSAGGMTDSDADVAADLIGSALDLTAVTGIGEANWIEAGETTGRGRNDCDHLRHGISPKRVWLYPLHAQSRHRLCRGV